jgi:hypothetical protein
MANDIFISYSRKDSKVVESFVERLESAGYKVWIDRTNAHLGKSYKSIIVQAIEDSTVILFFSSKNSNASRWTPKEIAIAVDRQKHIIPIKLDSSRYNQDVEFDLINLDYVDYYSKSNREHEIEKLIRTLKSNLGTPVVNSAQSMIQKEEFSRFRKFINLIMKNRLKFSMAILSLILLGVLLFFYILNGKSDGPQIVDLGLPSGTIWCDRNLGANNPYEKGELYPWGFVDQATREMGDGWSMPTKSQLEEIITYCNWKWTSIKGTYGMLGTSKKNGKTIFLPAAGRIRKTIEQDNTTGFYWSCEKNQNKKNTAYNMKFFLDSIYVDDGYTYWCRSIRPVATSKISSNAK